jgi:hypothetical protein
LLRSPRGETRFVRRHFSSVSRSCRQRNRSPRKEDGAGVGQPRVNSFSYPEFDYRRLSNPCRPCRRRRDRPGPERVCPSLESR